MKHKQALRFELKEITTDGTFEGLLSPYNVRDSGNDIIEPGAYTKTLKDNGPTRPLLWQHKSDVPVGEISLEDRPDGLWCKGRLLLELPEATKAYLLIKAKIVKGLSIGFESIKDSIENGIRHLKEVKLYEGSIVTFPMAESALITSVKAQRETKGDFLEELEEIQTLHTFYDMQNALTDALRSVVWSDDMERDEKIAMTATILEQFVDAFSAFFPSYLDIMAELYGPMETWNKQRIEIKERAIKAGAEFSASNIEKLKGILEKILDAHGSLAALLEDKAGPTTLESKAAEPKPEPAPDHSAVLASIRSLIPLTTNTN